MTAEFPKDTASLLQLRSNLESVGSQCRYLVEWLEESLRETIESIGSNTGEEHWKQIGSMKTLKDILRAIETPPDPNPKSDSWDVNGMGAV